MRHRKFWGATAVVGALAIFGAVIVPSTANAATLPSGSTGSGSTSTSSGGSSMGAATPAPAAAAPDPTAPAPTPAPSTSAPASKAGPHALSAQAAQSRVSGTLATWIVVTEGDDGPQVTLSNGQLLSTGGTVTGFVSHITSNSSGDTEGTLAYTDSGANPLSVPAVYQIDLAGVPSGYWIRADASVWGSDTSAHCFVSLGDPMQDGSSFPDPAPFTCRAEISGSFPHTQARFQVGLNAQALVHGNVVTTGSASLVSGVWDATAPGPLAVAPDSDATFSSSSVVDNTVAPGDPLANAAFAYRIDDHGLPTDYWVSAYAQTWNFVQNGGPSSSCQVFQGNPADGGHPAGSDAAYQCLSTITAHGGVDEATFTVSPVMASLAPGGAASSLPPATSAGGSAQAGSGSTTAAGTTTAGVASGTAPLASVTGGPSGLAETGSSIQLAPIAGALLALLAGGALVILRRRRRGQRD